MRVDRWSLGLRVAAIGGVVAVLAFGLGPSAVAGTGRGRALPPKVKASGAGRHPSAMPTARPNATRGLATRLGFCGGDDWEPEVATSGQWVYVVLAHFPGDTTCDPDSGNENRVYIQVSSDGGATFGAPHVVADVISGEEFPFQVDCVVTVDPLTGAVYVSYLAYDDVDTDVAVAKSTDHGATFTAVKVNGPECEDCDHPWTLAYGNDVYTTYAFNGNHYLSHSSDGGSTWTETNVLRADRVAFPEGGVIDADGNAWFAWGDCVKGSCRGEVAGHYRVSRTLAGTSTTTFALIASAPAGPRCPYSPNCGFAFFGIQDDMAIDAAGNLYLVWQDGQRHSIPKSPPIVQLSRCRSGLDCTRASSWSHVGRADDKNVGGCPHNMCYALFPRIEGGAANQIAVMWMDDRHGMPIDHENGWNVWVRMSDSGGVSWDGPGVQVSQYDPSRPESRPNGYLFPYGDYEGIDLRVGAVTTATMVWGEGFNYTGGASQPGHVVFRAVDL